MNDYQEIQQAISLYSEGCSRRDWDQVVVTFAAEGAWVVPARGIRIVGHAPIRAAMSAFVAGFEWFVQMNNPAIITIGGDRATARTVIRECGRLANSAELLEAMGYYDDKLVRTAEGWKFSERVFTSAGLHGLAAQPPSLP